MQCIKKATMDRQKKEMFVSILIIIFIMVFFIKYAFINVYNVCRDDKIYKNKKVSFKIQSCKILH